MTSATGRVDEFVKDYLTFRGLSTTLRTLESELKNEKEKGFRVDKMVEQLHGYILTYDLANLRDYWNFLANRLFSRLEQRYATSVRKLEVGLLKFYLVNASQSKQQDKILEFFERMTELLQTQSEFREWFAFPFVRYPEESSHYAMYFTRQWQDSFLLSLHNFLSVILQCMQPVLLNFEADYRRLRELQDDNDRLKQQLLCLGEKPDVVTRSVTREDSRQTEHNHMELLYDFSSLGEDTIIPEPASKSPRKFPFPSSPLSIVKKSDKQTSPSKKKDGLLKMVTVGPSKDSKSKSSGGKLLPVITRQKKSKSVSSQNQALMQETNQSVDSDPAANQKTVDTTLTNQRLRKFEEAKQASRKDTAEMQGEQLKAKDDKSKSREHADVGYTRSVSEPVEMSKPKLDEAQRVSSKSLLEKKIETVSTLVSSSVGTTMSASADSVGEELQSFPPPKQRSETVPLTAEAGSRIHDAVTEKPFLLLSQDEYSEHRSAVSYARFSNSGHYIASVDVDGVVKVWTWSPQAATSATVMSKSAFLSLEWASKSDRWLLLGNRSGNIRLFDVREMKSFYEATGDTSYPRVISLCSNPAGPTFVCSSTTGRTRSNSFGADTGPGTGSKIGKLTLWDLKTMKTDRQLPLEPGPVCINSCAFNHNGQLLVSGGVDGVIRMFDVSQQRCIAHWTAHTREIRTVMFSSDYTSCYSLGNDGKLIEWSVHKSGCKLRELPVHPGAIPIFQTEETSASKEAPVGNLLALDGDHLLGVEDTGAVIYKIMKTNPGMSRLMTLKMPRSSQITTVDWSPNIDTKVCLTGCRDGTVTVSTLLSQ